MIDQAYDITPNGITFSPAVTLRFTYYNLPAGMDPGSLQICYYDTTKNAWVIVPSTVNTTTNTISAQISHLTVYAITYGVKPVTSQLLLRLRPPPLLLLLRLHSPQHL